jgi:Ca-activated chloride channel homolog
MRWRRGRGTRAARRCSGFVLAGGENNYGKDGYSDTAIEKTLPITFDTKKRPPTIAMVAAVIDVSGSMSAGQLTIAKEAAKAPDDPTNA